MSDFADALNESGGTSAVAELSEPISAEPSSSTTPSDGGTSSPDPAAAGRGAAPSPGALPQTTTPTATAAPSAPAAPTAIAPERAIEVLRADPNFAPFLELQQQVSSGDLREVLGRFQQFAADPVAFHKEMGEQLRAAGMLEAEKPAAPFALPDPDLRTEDGTQTAYSAEAMAKIVQALRDDLTAQFTGAIKPFQTEHERAQSERAAADARAAETARLETGRAKLRDAAQRFDGFTELSGTITDLILADQQKPIGQRRFGDVPNLEMAYLVAKQSHQPALEERARQTVVSDLETRAAAGTASPKRRAATGSESREPSGSFKNHFKNNPSAAEAVLDRLGLGT